MKTRVYLKYFINDCGFYQENILNQLLCARTLTHEKKKCVKKAKIIKIKKRVESLKARAS